MPAGISTAHSKLVLPATESVIASECKGAKWTILSILTEPLKIKSAAVTAVIIQRI